MPANSIKINGEIEFELGDSKMPPIMKWLEHHAKTPGEGDKPDTIFAEMVTLMAKTVYGENFDFHQCVISKNGFPGIGTSHTPIRHETSVVTWEVVIDESYTDKGSMAPE